MPPAWASTRACRGNSRRPRRLLRCLPLPAPRACSGLGCSARCSRPAASSGGARCCLVGGPGRGCCQCCAWLAAAQAAGRAGLSRAAGQLLRDRPRRGEAYLRDGSPLLLPGGRFVIRMRLRGCGRVGCWRRHLGGCTAHGLHTGTEQALALPAGAFGVCGMVCLVRHSQPHAIAPHTSNGSSIDARIENPWFCTCPLAGGR